MGTARVEEALTNWAGNYTYRATSRHEPRTVGELAQIVTTRAQVRVLGTRHSFNDLPDSPGELVSLRRLPRVLEPDAYARQVRIDGGMTYGELVAPLDRAGLALANLASLPHIGVAGAVATATHGSGNANQTLAAAVAALELITADGSSRTVRRGDPDFAGTVVGLGGFGVVTALTLDCVPRFELATTVYLDLPWATLLGHLDEVMAAGYSVSVALEWNRPDASRVFVKTTGTPPPDLLGARPAREPQHPSFGVDPAACTEQLGRPGPWHARLPHFRLDFGPSTGEELQSEYLLPRPAGAEALARLSTLAAELAGLAQSTEVRTVAADDLWLSPAYERDLVAVHFTWRRDEAAVRALLPRVEALLNPLGARPHWGKIFITSAADLAAGFPRLPEVAELMAGSDPSGRFGNDYLDRHLGLDAHRTATSAV